MFLGNACVISKHVCSNSNQAGYIEMLSPHQKLTSAGRAREGVNTEMHPWKSQISNYVDQILGGRYRNPVLPFLYAKLYQLYVNVFQI